MSVLYLILPLALVLAAAFVVAFLWAVRCGQFDDVDTPSVRLVLEDREAGDPRPRTPAGADRKPGVSRGR